jgi:hypothetical protein
MLSKQPDMWFAALTTPKGPATRLGTARATLVACSVWNARLEDEQAEQGMWLVGFPPEMTEGWADRHGETITIQSSGGGFKIEVSIP